MKLQSSPTSVNITFFFNLYEPYFVRSVGEIASSVIYRYSMVIIELHPISHVHHANCKSSCLVTFWRNNGSLMYHSRPLNATSRRSGWEGFHERVILPFVVKGWTLLNNSFEERRRRGTLGKALKVRHVWAV